MSDEPKSSSGPFDVETVKRLVRLMKRFDVSELSLQEGNRKVRLRRGGQPLGTVPLAMPPIPAAVAPSQPPAPVPTAIASANKFLEIKSPMVGTFYAKPAPDKDDYVKVGTRVNPETVVCKIEAMKIFNDLVAGCSGVIAEICAQNGQFVEYDDVLFRVSE